MEKELRIINTKRASAFKKDLQKMVMLHQYLRKMILKNQKKKKKLGNNLVTSNIKNLWENHA